MIDLLNNTAGTKNRPIVSWKVVFVMPPLGVFTDRAEAVTRCSELEMNPMVAIIPVAAAITQDGEMELVYR